MLIIRGVNVFPSQIEELILKVRGARAALPARGDARGHLDSLAVHVECAPGQEDTGSVASELTRAVKAYIGVTVAVTVHPAARSSVPLARRNASSTGGGRSPQVLPKRSADRARAFSASTSR